MTIRLPDRWIWDSWYVWDGDVCHTFYLCASRALGDPNRRHRNVNVGHAISTDLVNWEIFPDALSPSESPAFDSWTTWTGSVVKGDDGRWWMYYTGTSREDGGDIQSVGASDCLHWFAAVLCAWPYLWSSQVTLTVRGSQPGNGLEFYLIANVGAIPQNQEIT